MKDTKYCPKCGTPELLWDGEKKWNCQHCDFVLYHNVAAAVAVVIRMGNEIFFTKRNQEPKKGKLDLAGGFTDPKESAEKTCERELFEELKLEIDSQKLKYLGSFPNTYEYKNIVYNTLDLFYEYEVEHKFEPNLEFSEVSEGVWLHQNEVDLEDLAFDSQKLFLKEYLRR